MPEKHEVKEMQIKARDMIINEEIDWVRKDLIHSEIERDFLMSVSDDKEMLEKNDINYEENIASLSARYDYLLKRLLFLKDIKNQRETSRKLRKEFSANNPNGVSADSL